MRPRDLAGGDVVQALAAFGFEVVGVRGSHCKLRRTRASGERQTLTVSMPRSLARGTVVAIFRQAARFVAEDQLKPHFFKAS